MSDDGRRPGRTPGPELAEALSGVDLAALSDGELIDVMAAWRRQTSWAQAGEMAAVAELARRREPGSSRSAEFVSAEVGLALSISPRSADAHLDLAHALAHRLPLTRQAMSEGHVDLVKARVIADGTRAVDDDIARAAERCVLPGASQLTPSRLRARVERAVIALDPAGAERRRKNSEADRRLDCYDTGNGTAVLGGAHLPAASAIAADNRLRAIARAIKADGDPRTIDQLSADVFLALLLGIHPASGLPTTELNATLARAALAHAITPGQEVPPATVLPGAAAHAGLDVAGGPADAGAGTTGQEMGATIPQATLDAAAMSQTVGDRIGTVHVTVPLPTLLGLSQEPGEVAGYGPLTAEVTRGLAGTASNPATRWCVTVTGIDGEPLHHGHPGYRPPPAMAHLVRTTRPTCCFPGCRRPARACDLDHRVPYDRGGATCPCNLHPLCRRHHRAKQAQGWQVGQRDGRLLWTTPAGRTYTSETSGPPSRAPGHPPEGSLIEISWHPRPPTHAHGHGP